MMLFFWMAFTTARALGLLLGHLLRLDGPVYSFETRASAKSSRTIRKSAARFVRAYLISFETASRFVNNSDAL